MMILNNNSDLVPTTEADKIAGVIITNYFDLDTKPYGSPHLTKCQARHKKYIHYRQARKKKRSVKKLMNGNNAIFPRKKDPGKAKFFIYHDKGHFVKTCPKSRKAKRGISTQKKQLKLIISQLKMRFFILI